MVDLPDGGVLGQQQAVAPAQLGDVAQQDDGAGDGGGVDERDATQGDGGLRAPLELDGDGQRALVGAPDGRLVEAEVPEAHALRVGVDAEPVQGRDAVRGRLLDPHLGVEDHHAVADAGQGVGVGVLPLEGEPAGGDHLGEPVEDVDVGALELARLTPEGAIRWPCCSVLRRFAYCLFGQPGVLLLERCGAPGRRCWSTR